MSTVRRRKAVYGDENPAASTPRQGVVTGPTHYPACNDKCEGDSHWLEDEVDE